MTVAQNRRKLVALRRVSAYVSDDEHAWLAGMAAALRCTVSRILAEIIADARATDAALNKRESGHRS